MEKSPSEATTIKPIHHQVRHSIEIPKVQEIDDGMEEEKDEQSSHKEECKSKLIVQEG